MLALVALAACGKKGASKADFDNATTAALTPNALAVEVANQPKTARITGFNIGHGLDRHDVIFGGASARFSAGDSVLISVRGLYLPQGTDVSARIRLKTATIDSSGAKSGAPDSAGVTNVGLRFGTTSKWAKGAYQVEVFLSGKFQMAQEITINQ